MENIAVSTPLINDTPTDLTEITGKSSGVVIYRTAGLFFLDWSTIGGRFPILRCGEDEISPGWLHAELIDKYNVSDVLAELGVSKRVQYDPAGIYKRLLLSPNAYSGTVFVFRGGTRVVTFD